MRLTRDCDLWYPNIDAPLAAHAMGPEIAADEEYKVRIVDVRDGRDEVWFVYDGQDFKEAARSFAEAKRAVDRGESRS